MTKARNLLIAGVTTAVVVVGYSAHVIATVVTGQSATATIVTPLSVTPVTALTFGNVSFDPGQSSSVTIDPTTNTATPAAGASVISGATRAVFDVSGVASALYTVNFTAVPGDITASGCGACPANSVEINTLTFASLNGGASGTIDGLGADTLWVGGILTMATTAQAGSYSGTYDMDVVYN